MQRTIRSLSLIFFVSLICETVFNGLAAAHPGLGFHPGFPLFTSLAGLSDVDVNEGFVMLPQHRGCFLHVFVVTLCVRPRTMHHPDGRLRTDNFAGREWENGRD